MRYEEKQEKISDVVAEVAAETGRLVNRWVLVQDVIDQDGNRILSKIASEGSRPWDVIGMLESAVVVEQGAMSADYDVEDDDAES